MIICIHSNFKKNDSNYHTLHSKLFNNEICYLIILQIPYNLSLIQSDLNIEPNLYIL